MADDTTVDDTMADYTTADGVGTADCVSGGAVADTGAVADAGGIAGSERGASRVQGPEHDRLSAQRDHLLKSLRDLDREHRSGDIDDEDYERLRERYTVEAADVIRALASAGGRPEDLHRPTGEQSPQAGLTARERGRVWKRASVAIGVVGFAVLSGVTVAHFAGQRGSNAITGSSGSLRDQLATCQPLAFSDPAKGAKCYADILVKAPENIEALTYQGWALVRAGDITRAGENFAKVVSLDPDYADVRVFRAVIAVRGGDFAAAADELTHFYRNNPSSMAIQVLQSQGLEREIFFGLQPENVRTCWQKGAGAGKQSGQLDADFYQTLGSCLDKVLESTPNDADALVSRAFAAAGVASTTGGSTIAAASPLLDRALSADPTNTNALVLRAGLNGANGNVDAAREDLKALEALPRPTISFVTGGPEQIAAGLQPG